MSAEADEKIALLMEETGCERGEAEEALEACDFRIEAALQIIARLTRTVLVVKAKFAHPDGDRFGLVLAAANTRTGGLLRCRAVLSYNPLVYTVPLEKDWFEFEKSLYGCRLWDGSLQHESLELERAVGARLQQAGPESLEALAAAGPSESSALLSALLRRLFGAAVRRLKVTQEILDLAQFRSLCSDPARGGRRGRGGKIPAEDQLVLRIELDANPGGITAADLRAGDMVSTRIVDARDIGQYLAKLFGGHSEQGPTPLMAPVEAIEALEDSVLVRVRFSEGVCGDATVARESRLKAVRVVVSGQAAHSTWWRRIFRR